MTLLQRVSRLLFVPALSLLCFFSAVGLSAQNKVSFSLQNRQTSAGVYSAELWATIASGSTWIPGNSIITISFNASALSIGSFDGAALLNADASLNSGGYMPMYQSLYGSALSVNIINLSGNFSTKTGSFRIGTVRWTILNGFQQDNLQFVTAGNDASIIGDEWNTLSYNCGTPECYGKVDPTPAQTGNPPVITQQPQALAACSGAPASLSVTATSALTYRWEKLNGATWQTIAGATSATLSFSNASINEIGSYRVVMTGNAPPVVTSQSVAVSLQFAPTLINSPYDAETCTGGTVYFATSFAGSLPVVMWEVLPAGTSTWISIAGATGNSLTLTNVTLSMNGNKYRARAINLCGSATSNPALLTTREWPSISSQPSSVVVSTGDNTAITVAMSGYAGTYEWRHNGSFFINTTTPTLSFVNAQPSNTGLYQVIAKGACGIEDTSDYISLVVLAVDTTKTTLVVKALMQGYWDGTSHVRTPVSVELRSGGTPVASDLTAIATGILGTTGTVSVEFPNVQSGTYWIVVRHGGYLPVASASAVQITRGNTANYDFSDAAAKAYSSGTTAVSIGGQTYYVCKGGDLNGSRSVNPQDLPIFLFGYPKTNATSIPGL